MALTAIQPKPRPAVPKVVRLAPELSVWHFVKLGIWCAAVLFSFAAVIVLSIVGGVCYGVLSGIGKVAHELTVSAKRDLTTLYRWATR